MFILNHTRLVGIGFGTWQNYPSPGPLSLFLLHKHRLLPYVNKSAWRGRSNAFRLLVLMLKFIHEFGTGMDRGTLYRKEVDKMCARERERETDRQRTSAHLT